MMIIKWKRTMEKVKYILKLKFINILVFSAFLMLNILFFSIVLYVSSCSSSKYMCVFSCWVSKIIMYCFNRACNPFWRMSPNWPFLSLLILDRVIFRILNVRPIWTNSFVVTFMWQVWSLKWSIGWCSGHYSWFL